jgi:sugar/nucleoside kinase (ribokinase family)
MKRVNVIIESEIYEKARAVAFVRKVSISEIFRKAIKEWMQSHLDKRAVLLLSESDEEKLLKILESDEFVSSEKAKKPSVNESVL